MMVTDSRSVEIRVASTGELEAALASRYGDSNCFWLSHDEELYPNLNVLIRGDLAYLYYIRTESEAGFSSLGHTCGESWKPVRFSISEYPADDIYAEPDAIVPVPTAIAVAKEFFHCKDLPQSIDWLEL